MECYFSSIRPDVPAVHRLPCLGFLEARGLPFPDALEIPSLASAIQSHLSYDLTYVDPGKENRGDTIGPSNPNRHGKAQGLHPLNASHSPFDFKAKL